MRLAIVLPVVVLFVTFAACSSDDDGAPPSPTVTARPPAAMTYDRFMYDASMIVPGFTGVSIDDTTRSVTIYASDPDIDAGAALAAAARSLPGLGYKDGSVRVVQVKYSFFELWQWYGRFQTDDTIWQEVPDIVGTDIDEVKGRIEIGVESEAGRQKLEEWFEDAGVPESAYTVVIEEPPVPL